MAQATLFNPKTGDRTAVEVGSRGAQDLFGQGYLLETPTQNLETYSATPSREILAGEGNQLLARDETGVRPVTDQRELSDLVHSGYQDSRSLSADRNLSFDTTAPSGDYTSPMPSGSATGSTSMGVTLDPAQQWQQAVTTLLQSAQRGGGDEDLEKQRNALIQARFQAKTDFTPEELRVLSPAQQAALRSKEASGITTQLGGVTAAMDARATERKEALNVAETGIDFALDAMDRAERAASEARQATNQERDDARAAVQLMYNQYGSSWLEALDENDKRNLETTIGLPSGTLDYSGQTINERDPGKVFGSASQGYYYLDEEGKPVQVVPPKGASGGSTITFGDGASGYYSGGGVAVDTSKRMSEMTQDELRTLQQAMQTREGYYPGSAAYDNNNPGNIKWGNFAASQGGVDSGRAALDGGTFARFPSYEAGVAAQMALLQSPNYQNLSLEQAMRRWSGGGYGADVLGSANGNQNSAPAEENLTVVEFPDNWDSEIGKAVTRLQKGETWGTVFNAVKQRFPYMPDKYIDDALGPQWKEPGAYEAYIGKQQTAKEGQKNVIRETDKYRFYSDGSYEAK